MFITLLILYYAVINSIGFATMAIDKRKAIKHQWRIPEATLLLVAFLGGGIGSWIGMHTCHHKTHKWKFKIGVPFSIILHISAILYLMTYFK
ncbi:DUF1294 domain-containing protein [Listeria rustica]|uniref:DUF1294 domain-containing protein n=1 Tax=Listeria rustica TaxID=2713503 RepID=A0A7W1YFP9_9LIST|nr:DUF1294 domain-containing protein [Listeria rustica]MBA3925935.1 DUF1294 domain-containing protein [Listeria rustica]